MFKEILYAKFYIIFLFKSFKKLNYEKSFGWQPTFSQFFKLINNVKTCKFFDKNEMFFNKNEWVLTIQIKWKNR